MFSQGLALAPRDRLRQQAKHARDEDRLLDKSRTVDRATGQGEDHEEGLKTQWGRAVGVLSLVLCSISERGQNNGDCLLTSSLQRRIKVIALYYQLSSACLCVHTDLLLLVKTSMVLNIYW